MEDNGKQLEVKKANARRLTDKNWLFIKHYLDNGDAPLAHKLAGYQGSSLSAPYEMVMHLRPEIELIAEERGLGRVKLIKQTSSLIDRPLIRIGDKGEYKASGLTPNEHMKALEFARKLTEKKDREERALSPVTIVTNSKGQTQVNFGKGTKAAKNEEGNGAERGEIEQSESTQKQPDSPE